MATPINVIIDNKTIVDDLESIEISQQEGTYCNTVSLSLKSKTFWSLCDPTTNFGVLRIKVVIGADTYQFLIEERDSTPNRSGIAFTVWGRSKQSLLSKPYSKIINDTDDTEHPWQTADSTASAIVAYVTGSAYCSYGVTVNWNVSDFVVYRDSFSVSNQSPIDVISSLAQVVGAEIKVSIDGSLSVESYSVDEGASVQSYDDLDDIVSLSESIDYPSGFNAVTVYGYGAAEGSVNAYISAEYSRLTDLPYVGSDSDTGSNIFVSRPHIVRVYYYHPDANMDILYSACSSQVLVSPNKCGTEEFTEDIQLIWGKGNTSKPNTAGVSEVTGDESVPIERVAETYYTNYCDFNVVAHAIGDFSIMFYFEDKSAYTVYSFTVSVNSGGGVGVGGMSSNQCSAIVIEKESPETIIPGDEVIIRIYSSGKPASGGSSSNTDPAFVTQSSEQKTEDITFTQGSASTAYPIASGQSPTYVWNGVYASPKYTFGESSLTVSAWTSNLDKYAIPAKVTYKTNYYVYKITIPGDWDLPTFNVTFQWTDCGIHNLGLTIDTSGTNGGTNGDGTSDITINIKDYVSSTDVESANIYIDGNLKGTTDASGLLNVSSISVGDHTIKITASGYQDSDQDDLANDNFTVAS